MAQLMRMGWFRPVHVKAPMVQEIRALLTARKAAGGQANGISRAACAASCAASGGRSARSARAGSRRASANSAPARPALERVVGPLLQARTALRTAYATLHRALLEAVREDEVSAG
jgi:transposase